MDNIFPIKFLFIPKMTSFDLRDVGEATMLETVMKPSPAVRLVAVLTNVACRTFLVNERDAS